MQQQLGSDAIYIGNGILDVTPYMDPRAEPRRGKDPKQTYSHLLQVRVLYLLVVVGTAAVHALLLIRHTYVLQVQKFVFSVNDPVGKHWWVMCVRLTPRATPAQVCVTVLSRHAELFLLTCSPRPLPVELDAVLDMRDFPSRRSINSFPTEVDRRDRPVP
jgi:hypothetical protein